MKFKIIYSDKIKAVADSMTVRQLLNQVLCPAISDLADDQLHEFGGAFIHPAQVEELKSTINRFKKVCSIPPFIVSDFENGSGEMIKGATRFPSMMGCSQANSEELSYEMGRIAAVEASTLGFNWSLSPVADLAAVMDSPVVSTRSAGNNPDHVIKILSSYIKGLQDKGMMATIKHFPGDGFGTIDQHLSTPSNPLDMESWYRLSGKVFKALIDKGVMAVMPGHISLPAYDDVDPHVGLYPPATFSRKLLVTLLRGKLGFEGLIISDAIGMGGASGFMRYYEGCARFFESGGDMLLFPKVNEAFYIEMEKLILKGVLKEDTLRDRAYRILSMKQQMGLFDKKEDCRIVELNNSMHRSVSQRIAEACITVVRDRKGIIPFNISRDTKILHLIILNNYESQKHMVDKVTEEIKKHAFYVDELVDPGPSRIFTDIYSQKYDLVICSIGSNAEWGTNVVRFHGPVARNMMDGWMKLGTPVVFISYGHPFIHKEYEASIDTLINTYGVTEYTVEYLMKGITGKLPLKREVFVHDL